MRYRHDLSAAEPCSKSIDLVPEPCSASDELSQRAHAGETQQGKYRDKLHGCLRDNQPVYDTDESQGDGEPDDDGLPHCIDEIVGPLSHVLDRPRE